VEWEIARQEKKNHREHNNVIIESFSKAGSTKIRNGISWFESKTKIHRVASTIYLSKPRYN
jgi:hypothetical protein